MINHSKPFAVANTTAAHKSMRKTSLSLSLSLSLALAGVSTTLNAQDTETIIIGGEYTESANKANNTLTTRNNSSGSGVTFTQDFDNVANSIFNNEGDVTFKDGKKLTNSGTLNLESGSSITTSGQGNITNNADATINAKENTKISGAVENSGTLNAEGTTFEGKVTTKDNSTITASGNNTFNEAIENVKGATLTNSGNVKIEQDLTNKGTLNAEAGSSFSTSSTGKIVNGDATDKGTLNAKGATFGVEVENQANGTLNAKDGTIFKKSVKNAKDGEITLTGGVTIDGDALTNTSGTLNVGDGGTTATEISGSGKIVNTGEANKVGNLNAKGATFGVAVENKENGKITATGENNFKGGVTNQGTFEASENSKISGDIANEKTLTAKGATFDSAITNNANGTITANTGTNTFNAKVDSLGEITAKDATFNGEVITGKTLTLEGGNTFNGAVTNNENGTITNKSGENTFNGDLVNKGTIDAEKDSKFLGTGTIQNEKTLTAKGATFDSAITNSANGTITANTGTNTFNGAITNSGTIDAQGATFGAVTNKDATGKINLDGNNTFSGAFDNGENATLTNKANANSTFNGDLVNKGTIDAENGSSFKGTGTIQNEKTLNAKGATFENTITNGESGKITATGENTFTGSVTNQGTFEASVDSKIKGTGKITNESSGKIDAKGATFENAINNKGTLKAEAAENKTNSFSEITTNAGSKIEVSGKGTNTFSKSFVNVKDATFTNSTTNNGKTTLSEGLINDGTLENKGDIEITSGVLTNSGTLNAESGSKFTGAGTITNNGELNAKGATFNGKVTNESGTITATVDNTFTGGVDNKGTLNAEASSKITGAVTNESSGVINAKGATFEGAITNKGNIIADGANNFNKKVTTEANSTIEVKSGTATFKDDLENVENATLKNSGTISIDASKKITNKGLLEAESGSKFSGDGSIENEKTLNAKGATFDTAITNKASGNITASGENSFNKAVTTSGSSTITISDGTTTFAEDFSNEENAKLVNNGEVVFSKAFTNKNGAFENKGTATFEGEAKFMDKGGTNAVDYTNQSSSTLTFNDSAEFKVLTNQNGTININGDGTDTKNFKAESITNYGNINANGGYIEATNGLNNHSIFRATGALSTIKGKFSNEANGNVYLQGTTLKVTDEFANNGNLIFSFLGDAIGRIDASDSGASFKNTDNKGKVQVDLSGSGKNIGEKIIIVGKDNNGTIDNITLNESDVSFIGGSGKYLGNGKVLIDEVFTNIPTGTINTPIIATNKANVASMNSMFLVSNAIISSNIYNAKYAKMAKGETSRSAFALSALKSNESFYYDSKPLLLADARASAQSQASGAQNAKDNFYFLLTPFVNHTSFKPVGGMSVSGLDYGFITAFGGKVAPDNTLGLHFVFDYAKLGDKNDKSLSATNKNIMVGLNYRLDLIYEMYLKARGDFYYFMNDVNSNATGKSSPNNLGGGVNVAFGKDFVDWKQAGVLGIELGLDYKALSTGKVSTEAIFGGSNDGIYDKALYHILYADLGLNYYKYFSTNVGLWGLDAGLGARANLTPKVSSNRLMIGNRNIDITLDNDNFLGYVSVGGSYVLEAQNYDMEFTLRYNGSFGDKTISNGGSFEWRTKW